MTKETYSAKASGPSEVSICNKALRYVGAQEIIALYQGSREAELCAEGYFEARNELLAMHNWSFATRYAFLAQLSNNSASSLYTSKQASSYAHAYQLPVNALQVQRLVDGHEFVVVENSVLLTNAWPAKAVMTMAVEDPTTYSPLFVEALARRLAVSLCVSLINNARLEQVMLQRFASAFDAACLADATQHGEKDISAFEDSWIMAR